MAGYYNLPVSQGALVAEVQPHSPADYAGIRKGDIIESIDGIIINNPSQIVSSLKNKSINDKLKITINRYGRAFDVEVRLLSRQ